MPLIAKAVLSIVVCVLLQVSRATPMDDISQSYYDSSNWYPGSNQYVPPEDNTWTRVVPDEWSGYEQVGHEFGNQLLYEYPYSYGDHEHLPPTFDPHEYSVNVEEADNVQKNFAAMNLPDADYPSPSVEPFQEEEVDVHDLDEVPLEGSLSEGLEDEEDESEEEEVLPVPVVKPARKPVIEEAPRPVEDGPSKDHLIQRVPVATKAASANLPPPQGYGWPNPDWWIRSPKEREDFDKALDIYTKHANTSNKPDIAFVCACNERVARDLLSKEKGRISRAARWIDHGVPLPARAGLLLQIVGVELGWRICHSVAYRLHWSLDQTIEAISAMIDKKMAKALASGDSTQFESEVSKIATFRPREVKGLSRRRASTGDRKSEVVPLKDQRGMGGRGRGRSQSHGEARGRPSQDIPSEQVLQEPRSRSRARSISRGAH